jgi:hypothetical protein
MPAQSEHELGAVNASIESTLQRLYHLRRHRNFLASPLLHLPTELILKIFVHAIKLDDHDSWPSDDGGPMQLVLTAICHQLREIGITSLQLWNAVDLVIPPIAELFLERCKYDPLTLVMTLSVAERSSMYRVIVPGQEALWEQLEGRTFNNLRSIVFEATPSVITHRILGVLRRAPNISSIDLCNRTLSLTLTTELKWLPGDPILPNLSALRLHNILIDWTSPLLRNLHRLTLGFKPPSLPFHYPSIEVFLAALANSPNLEVLNLAHAGPDLLSGHQDNCDAVVQLRSLRYIRLQFYDSSRIGCILSHIGYPRSTKVEVHVSGGDTGLPESMSQIFSQHNTETIRHFRQSTALTITLDRDPMFLTDGRSIHFQGLKNSYATQINPQALPQFASSIMEVVGRDGITSLEMEMGGHNSSDEMWRTFLHGLRRLERICYRLGREKEGQDLADPFVLVFSRPFEGQPVCPQLQHLELPRRVLTQDPSATVLKRALTERDACGRRLKRIGLSGDATEVGDKGVLEPFRDLVDEVQ